MWLLVPVRSAGQDISHAAFLDCPGINYATTTVALQQASSLLLMPELSGRTGRSFPCVQSLVNGQRAMYSLLAAVSSAVMTRKLPRVRPKPSRCALDQNRFPSILSQLLLEQNFHPHLNGSEKTSPATRRGRWVYRISTTRVDSRVFCSATPSLPASLAFHAALSVATLNRVLQHRTRKSSAEEHLVVLAVR